MSDQITADEARTLARQANNIQNAFAVASALIRSNANAGFYSANLSLTPYSDDIRNQLSHSLKGHGFEVAQQGEILSVGWADPQAASTKADALAY